MTLKLYEFEVTRSSRVRWTLLELGLPFESHAGPEMFHHPDVAAIHPLGKLPAFRDAGRPLFESAAICTWLADSHPEAGLIAPSGQWARALHDQWTCFALTEIEAFLWHTARNLFILPEGERAPAVYPQNEAAAKTGLAVIDKEMRGKEWLIDNRFSVTDIIVGYALCWAHILGFTKDMAHASAYADRLLARPLCPYAAMAQIAQNQN
ncbi:MAG TPA: glutathione S-transferase family protein [Terricaulis sp.]|nr:glutathione S-transferase family protein [Terricaulis sp.]